MIDMSSVLVAKSDQINAADLIGVSRTVRITGVKLTGKEQATEIRIADDDKVWRPNKNTVRIMARAWGGDGEKWIGRSATLYCDPKVKFGADQPGGIRISHLSDIDGKLNVCLQERKGALKTYVIEPLLVERAAPAVEQPADPRETATGWVERQKIAIAGCASTDALRELQAKRLSALNGVRDKFPDLAEIVDEAFKARRAEFDADEDAGDDAGDAA